MVYYTGNWLKMLCPIYSKTIRKSYLQKNAKNSIMMVVYCSFKRLKDIKIGETEYDKPEVITESYQYIVMRERGNE